MRMRHLVGVSMFALVVGVCVGQFTGGGTQRGSGSPSASQPMGASAPGNADDRRTGMPGLQEKQSALRNDDRQKRLVADSDRLLALATQLHEDVGRTDKNILSLDVVKRADEIEKLAHAVKERMKG